MRCPVIHTICLKRIEKFGFAVIEHLSNKIRVQQGGQVLGQLGIDGTRIGAAIKEGRNLRSVGFLKIIGQWMIPAIGLLIGINEKGQVYRRRLGSFTENIFYALPYVISSGSGRSCFDRKFRQNTGRLFQKLQGCHGDIPSLRIAGQK